MTCLSTIKVAVLRNKAFNLLIRDIKAFNDKRMSILVYYHLNRGDIVQ